MGASLKAINKAKARRQSHHLATKKYSKQRERTAYNKIEHQLLNAARNDKKLLATFVAGNGGWKKLHLSAQNALNMQGYIDALASKAGKAPHTGATPMLDV